MSMAAMRMLHGRYARSRQTDGHATTADRRDLGETLTELAETLEERLSRARRGDASAAHRARVATRRIRETLALVDVVDGRAAKDVRRVIRRLRRALGLVREIDVAIAVFDEEAGRSGWPSSTVKYVRERLQHDRERRRHDLLHRLAHIDAADLFTKLHRLGAAARSVSRREEASILSAQVARRAREFAAGIRGVGPLYRPEAMHDVRIAAKKLRYSLEIVRALNDPSASRDITALRQWQTRLGRLNDVHSLQTYLAGVAATAAPDATRRAIESMEHALDRECRGLHAAFLRGAPRLLLLADRVRAYGQLRRRDEPHRMAKMKIPREPQRVKIAGGL